MRNFYIYIASGKCSNDCLVLDGSHTKENHYGQDICQKERVIYGLILFNIIRLPFFSTGYEVVYGYTQNRADHPCCDT